MKYYFSKTLNDVTFESAVEKVTDELKKEGFGVISEINLQVVSLFVCNEFFF